jgi:hypothetical protein
MTDYLHLLHLLDGCIPETIYRRSDNPEIDVFTQTYGDSIPRYETQYGSVVDDIHRDVRWVAEHLGVSEDQAVLMLIESFLEGHLDGQEEPPSPEKLPKEELRCLITIHGVIRPDRLDDLLKHMEQAWVNGEVDPADLPCGLEAFTVVRQSNADRFMLGSPETVFTLTREQIEDILHFLTWVLLPNARICVEDLDEYGLPRAFHWYWVWSPGIYVQEKQTR